MSGYEPSKNKEYLGLRYREQREMFLNFVGKQCAICGAKGNLQIDHIDPSTKSFSVGRLWARKDYPKVFAELRKCQTLCFSCHIRKTGKENSYERGWRHGTWYGYQKKKCRCVECLSKARSRQRRKIAS